VNFWLYIRYGSTVLSALPFDKNNLCNSLQTLINLQSQTFIDHLKQDVNDNIFFRASGSALFVDLTIL